MRVSLINRLLKAERGEGRGERLLSDWRLLRVNGSDTGGEFLRPRDEDREIICAKIASTSSWELMVVTVAPELNRSGSISQGDL